MGGTGGDMTVLILMWKLYNEWRIWTEILEEEDVRGRRRKRKDGRREVGLFQRSKH